MTAPSTSDLIQQAIKNKQPLRATYDGYNRVLCPHSLGYKGGQLNLIAYQSVGDSSKGPVPTGSGHAQNWRCLHVDRLQNVSLISGPWATSDNHSRMSSCVDQFIAQVEY